MVISTMQISLPHFSIPDRNMLISVITRSLQFLECKDVRGISNTQKYINSFDQNSLLLVPSKHPIRNEQVRIPNLYIPSQHKASVHDYIKEIHELKYGHYVEDDYSVAIATTTALLINQIICNKTTENFYMLCQPKRTRNNPIFELEIALINCCLADAIRFYVDFLSFIFEDNISVSCSPTYFSWASVALKITHPDNPEGRFGAMGFIKGELLNLQLHNSCKSACLIGIPLQSICTLLSEM